MELSAAPSQSHHLHFDNMAVVEAGEQGIFLQNQQFSEVGFGQAEGADEGAEKEDENYVSPVFRRNTNKRRGSLEVDDEDKRGGTIESSGNADVDDCDYEDLLNVSEKADNDHLIFNIP